MSKRKPGQWWTKSWNIVTGCSWPEGQQPAACEHCWARSMARRFPALGDFGQVRCHGERLDEPLRRRVPTVYAVSLLGDLFHDDVPGYFIHMALSRICGSPRHRFVLLTKRPVSASVYLERIPRNAFLLASVWDQHSCDKAMSLFVSAGPDRWGLHCEPLLGPITLGAHQPAWVVVGGENGPGARPIRAEWVENILRECQQHSIPFWFKGRGTSPCSSVPTRATLFQQTPWEQV